MPPKEDEFRAEGCSDRSPRQQNLGSAALLGEFDEVYVSHRDRETKGRAAPGPPRSQGEFNTSVQDFVNPDVQQSHASIVATLSQQPQTLIPRAEDTSVAAVQQQQQSTPTMPPSLTHVDSDTLYRHPNADIPGVGWPNNPRLLGDCAVRVWGIKSDTFFHEVLEAFPRTGKVWEIEMIFNPRRQSLNYARISYWNPPSATRAVDKSTVSISTRRTNQATGQSTTDLTDCWVTYDDEESRPHHPTHRSRVLRLSGPREVITPENLVPRLRDIVERTTSLVWVNPRTWHTRGTTPEQCTFVYEFSAVLVAVSVFDELKRTEQSHDINFLYDRDPCNFPY
ncbi:hypothetical protein F5Y15DRAFT_428342 [Xylariaceae sp. FL0016]|nr:hypothetical protein F5Y15DRAFT_428342 [Xylariaceae sp. FL0016]